MKKSKFLALGLIALVLAGGLVLASCNVCPGAISGNGRGKCNFVAAYITSDYGKTVGRSQECEYGCISYQIEKGSENSDYSCDCSSYLK